jgi:hypothetical protein
MSVSTQASARRVVASLVAAVALGAALAGSASATDFASPPKMAPPAPAKVPAKAKLPKGLKSSVGRFGRPATRLHVTGSRMFSHSVMWCNSSQIAANDWATASTNGGTEWVQITNTLFRWNGSAWVKDVSGATAAAGGRAVVNFTNPWSFYPSGAPGATIGTVFTIGLHGYYYAVAQDIRWYSVATGQFLDRDYAWLNNGYGDSYYCSI